jgi:hypothetical protein
MNTMSGQNLDRTLQQPVEFEPARGIAGQRGEQVAVGYDGLTLPEGR